MVTPGEVPSHSWSADWLQLVSSGQRTPRCPPVDWSELRDEAPRESNPAPDAMHPICICAYRHRIGSSEHRTCSSEHHTCSSEHHTSSAEDHLCSPEDLLCYSVDLLCSIHHKFDLVPSMWISDQSPYLSHYHKTASFYTPPKILSPTDHSQYFSNSPLHRSRLLSLLVSQLQPCFPNQLSLRILSHFVSSDFLCVVSAVRVPVFLWSSSLSRVPQTRNPNPVLDRWVSSSDPCTSGTRRWWGTSSRPSCMRLPGSNPAWSRNSYRRHHPPGRRNNPSWSWNVHHTCRRLSSEFSSEGGSDSTAILQQLNYCQHSGVSYPGRHNRTFHLPYRAYHFWSIDWSTRQNSDCLIESAGLDVNHCDWLTARRSVWRHVGFSVRRCLVSSSTVDSVTSSPVSGWILVLVISKPRDTISLHCLGLAWRPAVYRNPRCHAFWSTDFDDGSLLTRIWSEITIN